MRPAVRASAVSILAAVSLAIAVGPSAASAQTWGSSGFDLVELPPGFIAGSWFGSVNDAGQVAGYVQPEIDERSSRAAIFDGSGITLLPFSDFYSRASAINEAGHVTGVAMDGNGIDRAYFSNGVASGAIGVVNEDFGAGQGINSLGHMVGSAAETISGRGFAWFSDLMNPGEALPLPDLRYWSAANAINDSDVIAGEMTTTQGTDAVVWDDNGVNVVANRGSAYAINETGYVTGRYMGYGGAFFHAFLHDGTSTVDLGTLGGDASFGYGISDAGMVVGWSQFIAGDNLIAATLWENGAAYRLDDIVGDGWFFSEATISGGGTILARGSQNGGPDQYVVLRQTQSPTVVPEPASMILLASGLMGVAGAARRRRQNAGSA